MAYVPVAPACDGLISHTKHGPGVPYDTTLTVTCKPATPSLLFLILQGLLQLGTVFQSRRSCRPPLSRTYICTGLACVYMLFFGWLSHHSLPSSLPSPSTMPTASIRVMARRPLLTHVPSSASAHGLPEVEGQAVDGGLGGVRQEEGIDVHGQDLVRVLRPAHRGHLLLQHPHIDDTRENHA